MRITRALAAATVLVGLIVGLPAALVTYGRLPNGSDLADLPTEALTDSIVFALLTLLAWMGWAIFTLTVLVELAAAITGRASWRMPVRTPFEATARRLVAAITMSITLTGPVLTRMTPGPPIAARQPRPNTSTSDLSRSPPPPQHRPLALSPSPSRWHRLHRVLPRCQPTRWICRR